MSDSNITPQTVQALTRKVWFYRAVAVALAVLLGMLALKLKRLGDEIGEFGEAGQTWAVDLSERVAIIEKTKSDLADFAETYLQTPEGSVHLHAMGKSQMTPLHVHPASDELTVIASGTAHVTQMWGEDGGVASRVVDFPPASVIPSPRFVAHEWKNESEERLLFNVVFTSPKFSGNFHIKPDDKRVLNGVKPTTPEFTDDQLVHRPELNGHLWTIRVTSKWTSPKTMGTPLMIFVLDGQGHARKLSLHNNLLVHLEHDDPITFEASEPMRLVIFDVTGRALH